MAVRDLLRLTRVTAREAAAREAWPEPGARLDHAFVMLSNGRA